MRYLIKNMKSLNKEVFCIAFMLMTISFTIAQEPTIQDQLIGNWIFDDVTSFATIEPATQAKMDSIPQFKTQLIQAYRGRSTYFGGDGSYRVTLADGRSVTGNWSLTPSGTIKITDTQGHVSYQQIAALENNRLVLIPVTSGNAKSIVTQQHFIKR
ncbi:hypothetical protein GTQ40_12415 [Flavobacteriaceae bacterium R38]|nr:hypothetical protein [Flavobacteriaceae bacterium R38]